MTTPDTLDVALRCAAAFEQLGLGYFLGGSLASSFQGEARATNDIDFVVDLRPADIKPLAAALGEDFEVDVEALEEAVRRRASWNIFFLPMVVKVDLFVKGTSPFDESEFARRRRITFTPEARGLYIKSPEDTVLRKLLWFRAGGEVSSTQWRDIIQVLRMSGPQLDLGYLDHWAAALSLTGLLQRARGEAAR